MSPGIDSLCTGRCVEDHVEKTGTQTRRPHLLQPTVDWLPCMCRHSREQPIQTHRVVMTSY